MILPQGTCNILNKFIEGGQVKHHFFSTYKINWLSASGTYSYRKDGCPSCPPSKANASLRTIRQPGCNQNLRINEDIKGESYLACLVMQIYFCIHVYMANAFVNCMCIVQLAQMLAGR